VLSVVLIPSNTKVNIELWCYLLFKRTIMAATIQ